ncbi:hypothetical protein JG688_00016593 [Phytophthora aleatoria]|uniref:Uncharacterized protein n=1 Tax=Phytophthora aleatoria TaxID=2496075 RepID=A0A8J5IIR0_9STRA|nr:hypothetical protein JG688_00016593 [Phytophthora aleatoria]
MEFLSTILPRDYGKQLGQCYFLVADNSINRAVQVEMEDYQTELDVVQKLMIRLRTLTQSAKLRMKTKLRPVIHQDT